MTAGANGKSRASTKLSPSGFVTFRVVRGQRLLGREEPRNTRNTRKSKTASAFTKAHPFDRWRHWVKQFVWQVVPVWFRVLSCGSWATPAWEGGTTKHTKHTKIENRSILTEAHAYDRWHQRVKSRVRQVVSVWFRVLSCGSWATPHSGHVKQMRWMSGRADSRLDWSSGFRWAINWVCSGLRRGCGDGAELGSRGFGGGKSPL